MKNKYFIIFVSFATVLLIILSYLRFPYFRYLIREAFNGNDYTPVIYDEIIFNNRSEETPDELDSSQDMLRSTREDIHTVLKDGVWRIDHPNYIPQFGGDLQNTGVYPGDGIRGIQIIDDYYTYDSWPPSHEGKLVYKIRHGGLICSSPAVYDRIIYFGTNDGHFYAIDIDSWEENWVVRIGWASKRKRNMPVTAESCPPAPAIFSSPVIYDGVAYFGTTYGYVFALNTNNGDIIWRAEIPMLGLCNPKIYEDFLYIGSKNRHLYKLDAKTGDIIWRHKTQGEIIATPAIYEDKIFINCQEGHLYAIDTGGNLIWKIDMGVPTRNSPVISEEIVFLDTDYFHAIDTSYGREIWRAGPYNNISQCAVSKGRVYFRGIDEQHSFLNYANFYSYNIRSGKLEWKSQMRSYEKKTSAYIETRITERWDSGVSGSQLIISGDMVHSVNIRNSWYKYEDKYKRHIGEIFGFIEDEKYYMYFPNYPHPNPNLKHDYALEVRSLHSPVALYDEVMYYGAEIYDKDGCYTGLYAMKSMQDEFRWLPWRPYFNDLPISYPLVSENAVVLYDIEVKEGNNTPKDRDPNMDPDEYTTEFQIVTYDIQSKEVIYSGTCDIEETGPLTIFERSSAIHSGILFLEAGIIRNIEKEAISRVITPDSRIIYTSSGNKVSYERQLISSAYYAFDITTGNLIWKHDLGEKILNSPPLIYEDKIYVGSCYMIDKRFNIPVNLKTSNKIFNAIDAKTGEEIWKIEIIGNTLSRPLIYSDILYFGTDEGYVYAIDRFEGEILWIFHINGGISSTPVVYDDMLFIGSWNWNIYAIDPMTGKGICKFRARGEIRGDILAHDGHLYFLCQTPIKTVISIPMQTCTYLQSINIKTGLENCKIRWCRPIPYYHILLTPDIIYSLGLDQIFIAAIDIKTGSIIWKLEKNDFNTVETFSSRFLEIIDDKIFSIFIMSYRPAEGSIIIIDANSGKILLEESMSDMGIPQNFIDYIQRVR